GGESGGGGTTMADGRTDQRGSVAGRVVIVTGGGAGIGRGIATHFVRAGASVAIGEKVRDRLADVIEALEPDGVVVGIECDVGQRTDVEKLVESTVATFGLCDGIVNNAM